MTFGEMDFVRITIVWEALRDAEPHFVPTVEMALAIYALRLFQEYAHG
jgi:hypothetical protein